MDYKTRLLPMTDEARREALALFRTGQAVAFPTDTVYGLGADGLDASAIERLYAIKNRPGEKAIPFLLADQDQVKLAARVWDRRAQLLARRFWPGALTIVVPAKETVPEVLRAGNDTIALRVPNLDWLRRLIYELGRPLATTSANLSGAGDSTTASAVLEQLDGRIPLIVDGGTTSGGRASTVVDLATEQARVLREGEISSDQIRQVLSSIEPRQGRG